MSRARETLGLGGESQPFEVDATLEGGAFGRGRGAVGRPSTGEREARPSCATATPAWLRREGACAKPFGKRATAPSRKADRAPRGSISGGLDEAYDSRSTARRRRASSGGATRCLGVSMAARARGMRLRARAFPLYTGNFVVETVRRTRPLTLARADDEHS
jgi:hypothetical protein